MLQFLLCYLRSVSAAPLAECWTSLLALLRDAAQLTPPAQFLLLAVLNEYVQRAPPLPEKKDQRDLQDVAAKVSGRRAGQGPGRGGQVGRGGQDGREERRAGRERREERRAGRERREEEGHISLYC